MARRYDGINPSSVEDPAVKEALHVLDRYLKQRSNIDSAFEQINNPTIKVVPGPGRRIGIHTHQNDHQGGNVLGAVAHDILTRGDWHFRGDTSGVETNPSAIIHVVGNSSGDIIAVPNLDITDANWRDQGGGASLFEAVDDLVSNSNSDTTFIEEDPLAASNFEVRFADIGTIDTEVGLRVNFRMRFTVDTASLESLTWTLREGGIVRASASTTIDTTTFTDFSIALTDAEVLSITATTDLRIRASAGGGVGTVPQISRIWLSKNNVGQAGDGNKTLSLFQKAVNTTAATLMSFQDENAVEYAKVDSDGTTRLGGTNTAHDASVKLRLDATATQSVDMFQSFTNGIKTVFIDKDGIFNLVGAFVVDHGGLTGLGDDDHTQYVLLAGRTSPSQTIIGGTASGDDLTLQSTSNATRGDILFGSAGGSRYLEATDRFAVNRSTASSPIHVDAESATIPAIIAENNLTTGGASDGAVVSIVGVRTDLAVGVSANKTLKVVTTLEEGFGGGDNAAIDATMDGAQAITFPDATAYGALKFLAKSHGAVIINELFGAKGRVDHLGSGTVTEVNGFAAVLASTGIITSANGLTVFGNFPGATITNYRNFRGRNPLLSGGATITNLFGLFLENMTSGTNDWAIFSEGADSFFQDRVRIGAALRLIEAGGASGADHVEIKAPAVVGTSYGIELDDNGPANDAIAKYAALSGAVTLQTYVDIPTGTIWMTAGDFLFVSDNASEATYGTAPASGDLSEQYRVWELGADSLDAVVGTHFFVPNDYSAGTVLTYKLYWSVLTATVGNAVLKMRAEPVASGGAIDGSSDFVATQTVSTNVTADTLQITTFGTSSTNVAAGKMVRLNVIADGDNAGFTGTFVGLVGVLVEYTRNI